MTNTVLSPSANVGRLATRPAVMVPPDTSIRQVAAAMRSADVSSALVGDSHAIVTERDLTDAWANGTSGDDPVSLVASHHPVVVGAGTEVVEAAAIMLNRGVRHLIVIGPGDQAGVVSLRAVMGVLLHAAKPELWLSTLAISFQAPPELWLG